RPAAAVSPGPGRDVELREAELTDPRDHELVVAITATGLCDTDHGVRDALPPEASPRVPGHQRAGAVGHVSAGVEGIEADDHLVLGFRACPACDTCRSLGPAYCTSTIALNYLGTRPDGSTTYRDGAAGLPGSFFGHSSLSRHAIAYADNAVVVAPGLDLTRL